jgi:hypothetical protein
MKKLSYLERKHKLFSPDVSDEERIRWGDHYLELDRLNDAVAFYRQARHAPGLERILQKAVDQGDYQLFREAEEGLNLEEKALSSLKQLAKRAEEAGRWYDALKAYERLGHEVGAQRARRAIARLLGHQGAEKAETETEGEDSPSGP